MENFDSNNTNLLCSNFINHKTGLIDKPVVVLQFYLM